jgi:trehalose-6-phosphatase
VLLMNCSGIILPLPADRTRALPDAEVKACLTKLSACRTRLIVISARPAYEVSALLALTPAVMNATV